MDFIWTMNKNGENFFLSNLFEIMMKCIADSFDEFSRVCV